MENTAAFFGALFLIGVVVGVNALMYGIVRSITHSSKRSFLEMLGDSFNPPNLKKKDAIHELHQKIAELTGEKQDPPPGSE